MHTGRSLHDIADIIEKSLVDIASRYKAYANHVCVQRYMEPGVDVAAKQQSAEETWPVQRQSRHLAAIPEYLGSGVPVGSTLPVVLADADRWMQAYHADLDYVMEKRQEHIHPKDKKGVR